MDFQPRPVTERCRAWLSAQIGPCSIGSPLSGATTATVVPINTADRGYVLKWFTWQRFVDEDPERVVHEVHGLDLAAATGVPAPHVVAFDTDGDETGHPALLMTRVAGSSLPRPADWTDRAADAAARLHASTEFPRWAHSPYFQEPFVPDWASDRGLWHDAIAVIAGLTPSEEAVIHRDLHRWNMHWRDASLTGIVDWLSMCSGPIGEDVGRVWINEVLEGHPEEGLRFRAAYAATADRAWDVRWEIQSAIDMLPSYVSDAAVHEWGDEASRRRLETCLRIGLDFV